MENPLQIVKEASEQLEKRVEELLRDYQAKRKLLLQKNCNESSFYLIEKEYHALRSEIKILEEEFKLTCIKHLTY
jgi:hypothetical protein